MQIPGLGPVPFVPSSSATPPTEPVNQTPVTEPERSEDRVDVSPEALSGTHGEGPDVRALRLAQIKAAIEAGEYETQDKLDAALSRLFGELGLEDDTEH